MIEIKIIKKGARFSICKTYRYSLWRIWDETKKFISFIGLNPSTADQIFNDSTVTRCINFAYSWGYGGLYMLNEFAYRATEPKEMKKAEDPVGPRNNYWLNFYSKITDINIACWGNHGSYMQRNEYIKTLVPNLYYLDITKQGEPKHPLYIKSTVKPKRMII